MRRLFVDIETSKNIVEVWRTGSKIFVSPDDIIKERAVICVAWKWQGGKVETLAWDKHQSDKAMVKKALAIISGADEVIAHNGEKFDMPWLRGRALIHGLPPLPIVRLVDTLKWARKYYYLNSNRLDYLGKMLGVGGKAEKFKHGYGSWRKVSLDNDRKELADMVEYCARDVELLEKVWERLSVICPAATHAGVMNGGEKWSCPRCASHDVFQNQRRVTARGTEQYQMKCKACFGFYTVSARARDMWQNGLTEFIRRRGGAVTVREVMQSYWPLKNQREKAEAMLSELVAAGLARWDKVKTIAGGGRPTRKLWLEDRKAA